MIQLVADENLNNNIIRGVLRQRPEADIVRVQDMGLSGVDDPGVLEWAAQHGRILLTHDVSTITRYACERIDAGKEMSGVFEVSRAAPIGPVIESPVLLLDCSLEGEWAGQIIYLPLK